MIHNEYSHRFSFGSVHPLFADGSGNSYNGIN